MKTFSSGSHTGFSDGAKMEIIARIQDMKASPAHGQKRLVVQERGKHIGQRVIDIDMKYARDLEEKETYVFKVTEKDDHRNGFKRAKSSSSFKAYHCEEEPDDFKPSDEHDARFSRFGGGARPPASKRTRF